MSATIGGLMVADQRGRLADLTGSQ